MSGTSPILRRSIVRGALLPLLILGLSISPDAAVAEGAGADWKGVTAGDTSSVREVGQLRAPDPGWEIRISLDGSRKLTRRVRTLLHQSAGRGRSASFFGNAFPGFIRSWATIPDWPGLDGRWTESGPVVPSQSSVEEDDESPWTVAFTDPGEEVLSLRPPLTLPRVPEEIDLSTRKVVWVLRKDPSGKVVWATGFGTVAGSPRVAWEAFWKAEGAEGPASLDEALREVPGDRVGRLLARSDPPPSWSPLRGAMGALATARYNQVEGASIALPVWMNLTPTAQLSAWTRLSTSSYPPTGGMALTVKRWPGRWGVEGYRRLEDANRWEPVERKRGKSAMNLLFGQEDGHYYTATGVSLWTEGAAGLKHWKAELFAESDRTAPLRVEYALFPREENTRGPGLEAESGNYYGLRGTMEFQRGREMAEGILVASGWAEMATGDTGFLRFAGVADGLKRWGWLAVGARVGAGLTFGDAPVQRQYFLGGVNTLRGFLPGTLEGPVMALSRLEVGFGPSLIRVVGFGDLGWAGAEGAMGRGSSAGFGISIMEGVLRLDFAKVLDGGEGMKFYLTGNGLL